MSHTWIGVISGALVAASGFGCAGEEEVEQVAPPETRTESSQEALTTPIALNPSGVSETFGLDGVSSLVLERNEFFDDLGTNGRRCETCHRAAEGFTIRPALVQLRFLITGGRDPLFRTVDGSNSPLSDVSSVHARRRAYSLLLERGVIRVGLRVPSNAEFELTAVEDPSGYSSSNELSLFRRPLPSVNLPFNTTIMWDGRETVAGRTLQQNLASQAAGATHGHAQRVLPLNASTLDSIVAFESALFQAQSHDSAAGSLTAMGARGGPSQLAKESFGATGNVRGFDLFDAWAGRTGKGAEAARASIARGQALFNLVRPAGTCTNCHDAHNIGTHTRGVMFDIGVSAPARRTASVPLYTLRNKVTGEERQTMDPGRALITGLWRDVDRFKVPSLRGLAARAPYFHDGSAATLDDVVDLSEARFGFTLTAQEQADLVAFLRAL